MLGYICKYAPVEVFTSMGVEMKRIEPDVTSFTQADIKMHPNICSFAKGVLEDVLANDYEGVILTTCCDSIRRLYDVLREELPGRFVYMLDTPRTTKEAGVALYETRIRNMIKAYEEFSGKSFNEDDLARLLEPMTKDQTISIKKDRLNIGLIGARANETIVDILSVKGANIAFDLTCTGIMRKYLLEPGHVLEGYTRGLLSQFPCMRMEEAAGRDKFIDRFADSVDGVIYHTVQFCDNYSYEYAWLKKTVKSPMLLLETDYTRQSRGQILTRIEAFLESLRPAAPERSAGGRSHADGIHANRTYVGEVTAGGGSSQEAKNEISTGRNSKMYVMGIDSGSTSTNAVIMDTDKKIIASTVVRTGAKSADSAARALEEVLRAAGLSRGDLSYIVSTGYGRVSIDFADENVTEISCHGRGAHYFNPSIRTILDIGGQDSKAIHLNSSGEVTDFVMNDKCAAGTGRFLEMIARTLEIDISELGPAALNSTEEIEITSMCSVFAESEVISLIANNKEKPDIAWGVCKAIANKAYSLLKRVGMEKEFMMTGGVAKNPGVVKAVEERIGASLYICEEPEIVGAAGAALYAVDKL